MAEHSSGGQRCSQRYEWYQTPSDVVLEVMIPSVKDDDILVEFAERKVGMYVCGTERKLVMAMEKNCCHLCMYKRLDS